MTENDIKEYLLATNQYVHEKTVKDKFFIHHTAGGHNPYQTVDFWNSDTALVGTEFVIGGICTRTGDKKFNGLLIKCVPDDNWIAHTGFDKISKTAWGVEICNYGWLNKDANGKFFNVYGGLIPPDMVCELPVPYKGGKYFHAYTPEQIDVLKFLLTEYLPKRGVDTRKGLKERLDLMDVKAFDLFENVNDAMKPGVYVHGNVLSNRTDAYPHPQLIELIKNL